MRPQSGERKNRKLQNYFLERIHNKKDTLENGVKKFRELDLGNV
jgi:hypothetical protein